MGEWRMDQVGEPKVAVPHAPPPSAGLSAGPRPTAAAPAAARARGPERASSGGRRRAWTAGIAILLLLGAGAGVGWYTLIRDPGPVSLADVPLIRADHTPVRLRPEEPGGIDVPHLDRAVLHDTERGSDAPEIGTIAPPPEEPVARPAPAIDIAAERAGQEELGSEPAGLPVEPTAQPAEDIQIAPLASFPSPEALIDRAAPGAEAVEATGAAELAGAAEPTDAAVSALDAPEPPDSIESVIEALRDEAAAPINLEPAASAASPDDTGAADDAPESLLADETVSPAADPDAGDSGPSDALPPPAQAAADDPEPLAGAEPVAAGPAGPFLAAQLGVPPDLMSVEPEPTPITVIPALPTQPESEGDSRIQVAAVESEEVARQEWVRFQGQFPSLLGDLQLIVTTVEVNGQLFYRIQGGLLTEAAARDRCRSLQDLGADCIVR